MRNITEDYFNIEQDLFVLVSTFARSRYQRSWLSFAELLLFHKQLSVSRTTTVTRMAEATGHKLEMRTFVFLAGRPYHWFCLLLDMQAVPVDIRGSQWPVCCQDSHSHRTDLLVPSHAKRTLTRPQTPPIRGDNTGRYIGPIFKEL